MSKFFALRRCRRQRRQGYSNTSGFPENSRAKNQENKTKNVLCKEWLGSTNPVREKRQILKLTSIDSLR